jgi:hypothetical protein
MKATIPTLAPALAAILAIAVLWAAPAWAAAPAPEGPSPKEAGPSKETVSAQDIEQLAAQLYVEGVEAQQAGKLGLARAKLRAALSLAPRDARAKAALAQVEKSLGITDADRMKEKLAVRIPEVSFKQAPLREVVEYLAQEADVNIVFHAAALETLATGQEAVPPDEVAPEAEQPGGEMPGFAPVAPPAQARTDLITIHLKNVPLREVLRYVLRYKGLKYVVEEYAILIVPIGWEPPDDMEMEVFRLATGITGARRLDAGRTDQTGF